MGVGGSAPGVRGGGGVCLEVDFFFFLNLFLGWIGVGGPSLHVCRGGHTMHVDV